MPVSLTLHLKTITMNRFKGRRDEMEAVKYLLKNGEVLSRMVITMRTSGLSDDDFLSYFW